MTAISHPAVARELNALMRSEITLELGFGDSNDKRNGEGSDLWRNKHLADTYGLAASHAISPVENANAGAYTDFAPEQERYKCALSYNRTNLQAQGGLAKTAASPHWKTMPGSLDQDATDADLGRLGLNSYLYFPNGVTFTPTSATQRSSLLIDALHPVVSGAGTRNLRALFAWAGFSTGSGSFRPYLVEPNVESAVINTNTGADDFRVTAMDFTHTAGGQLRTQWNKSIPTIVTIVGPFIGYWSCVVDRDATAGVIPVDFAARGGGWSVQDIVRAIGSDDVAQTGQSDTPFNDLFSMFDGTAIDESSTAIAQIVGPSKVAVCWVTSAINDANIAPSTLTSLGPAPADSSTIAGYKDNLRAFVKRTRRIATAKGWRPFVVLRASHPRTINDSVLVPYRTAVTDVAGEFPDCFAIDMSQLISADDILAQGLYESGGLTETNQSHFTIGAGGGYDVTSRLLINAISMISSGPRRNRGIRGARSR